MEIMEYFCNVLTERQWHSYSVFFIMVARGAGDVKHPFGAAQDIFPVKKFSVFYYFALLFGSSLFCTLPKMYLAP